MYFVQRVNNSAENINPDRLKSFYCPDLTSIKNITLGGDWQAIYINYLSLNFEFCKEKVIDVVNTDDNNANKSSFTQCKNYEKLYKLLEEQSILVALSVRQASFQYENSPHPF